MPMSRFRLKHAARILAGGGVVAYPTEAVFGLGCDPSNAEAVARLLAIKRRPQDKGVILIAADSDQLAPFVTLDDPAVRTRIGASWPGPVTWLIPTRADTPRWLTGAHDTLAVRVTAHPVAAALCRLFQGPVVSTSANRSGRQPARTAAGTRLALGTEIDDVVPGRCGDRRKPTEIRDARDGAVVRAG